MKKLLSLIILITLVLAGLGASAVSQDTETTTNQQEHLVLSDISVHQTTRDDYLSITLSEANAMITRTGEPMLPTITRQYRFPMGTKISDISVRFSEYTTTRLSKKIIPAPTPVARITQQSNVAAQLQEEQSIYQTSERYPTATHSYSVHTGSNGEQPITILNLVCYPVYYQPDTNEITSSKQMDITIQYTLPTDPVQIADDYDMVVIAPESFSQALQPLIDHKNSYNVRTYLKTTEEIYDEYTGFDKPEQIKYFIKDSLETTGIDYVLLVGGMTSPWFGTPRDDANQGSSSWHVPVRYTNLKDEGGVFDPGYISDLYYADIYDGEGNFSTWDSNEDEIFAKWSNQVGDTDEIDHYPELAVGRLACRNTIEVQKLVDKIIAYESTAADDSWFNKIILVGGDSHNDAGTNFIEGEVVCDKIHSIIPSFDAVKLYASYRDNQGLIPSPTNLVSEISKGAGFLLFDGHGNPASWNTHWPGEFNWEDTPGGIKIWDFLKLRNKGKPPVMIVGGCHNSQFNVSLAATLLNKPFMWTYGYPTPECFSWWLARKFTGGTIASIGSTGLGYGYVGNHSDIDGDGVDEPDTLEGLGPYLAIKFFEIYQEGNTTLGTIHQETITRYLNVFPSMGDKIQMKQIQEWPLLGDPSLKIGGYAE